MKKFENTLDNLDSFSETLLSSDPIANLRVIRRNGSVTEFDANRITVAMKKAFLAVEGDDVAHAHRIQKTVEQLTQHIIERLKIRRPTGGTIHIESIQDQVELALMRAGEQKVAHAYVWWREMRNQERSAKNTQQTHYQCVTYYRI